MQQFIALQNDAEETLYVRPEQIVAFTRRVSSFNENPLGSLVWLFGAGQGIPLKNSPDEIMDFVLAFEQQKNAPPPTPPCMCPACQEERAKVDYVGATA